MRQSSIAFLLGICAVLLFSVLPNMGVVFCALFFLAVLSYFYRQLLPLLFLALGVLWMLLNINYYDHSSLVKKYQYEVVRVCGTITSIPVQGESLEQFLFDVDTLNNKTNFLHVSLSWYDEFQRVYAGDRWCFNTKLKKPRGFSNPGSVDVEKTAVANHIDAKGYIVSNASADYLGESHQYLVLRYREKLNDMLKLRLSKLKHEGILRALTLGVRDGISQKDWQLFRETGTSHLMSISGLHVGLVAAVIYFLKKSCVRFSSFVCLRLTAHRVATIAALFFAFSYCVLTGFGIPEQRALVMLAVFMLSSFCGVHLAKWTAYCLSLWIVLLIDPMGVMLPGFWLSFVAVAIILCALDSTKIHWIVKWLKVQWGLFIGLFPLSLWFFGQFSLISPLVNCIAIFLIGCIVVPISLLALLLLPFLSVSQGIFACADKLLSWLSALLSYCALLPFSSLYLSLPSIGFLLILLGTSAGVLFVKKIWQKVLVSMGYLVLLLPISPVANGQVDFSVLDVGQGLATVVRTKNHVLVYDSGPYYGGAFNAGDAVVIPFLRYFNVRQIDIMMLSHGHVDHTGGASAVLRAFPATQVLTSIPRFHAASDVKRCYGGQHWVWDDVQFDVVYPPKHGRYAVNNSSCVLRVQSNDTSFLLTGDIEKEAERYLVSNNVNVKADVLVAPHHGSNTSSTPAFLQAVSPSLVLFSSGYRNHYHFPHPSVVARFQHLGVLAFNTAINGQVRIMKGVSLYRNAQQHWWNSN